MVVIGTLIYKLIDGKVSGDRGKAKGEKESREDSFQYEPPLEVWRNDRGLFFSGGEKKRELKNKNAQGLKRHQRPSFYANKLWLDQKTRSYGGGGGVFLDTTNGNTTLRVARTFGEIE